MFTLRLQWFCFVAYIKIDAKRQRYFCFIAFQFIQSSFMREQTVALAVMRKHTNTCTRFIGKNAFVTVTLCRLVCRPVCRYLQHFVRSLSTFNTVGWVLHWILNCECGCDQCLTARRNFSTIRS